MNSSSKTKLPGKPKNTLKKDRKFQNGRWTEREHYLFLLAVKQFGKDWKKIEGFVKTRSSTQSRSHAQKVLKDDLMNNIENEIQRLALIYEKVESVEEKEVVVHQTSTNSESVPNGVKGKRKAKRAYKEAIKKRENQKVAKPSPPSSQSMDEESKEGNSNDESFEVSEYSYPDDFKTKLFEIEKVVRKKTSKRRKRPQTKKNVAKRTKALVNTRKDSVMTAVSSTPVAILSPAKTASTDSLTPNLRGRREDPQFRIKPFGQNGGVSSKKNGRQEEGKPLPQNGMVPPKINQGLRRASSLRISTQDLGSNPCSKPPATPNPERFFDSNERQVEESQPAFSKKHSMEASNFNSLLFED